MTGFDSEPGSGAGEKIPFRDRPITEVVYYLQGMIGRNLVAYSIDEKDPRIINRYLRLKGTPDEKAEKTLRDLAEVVEVLTEKDSPDIARAVLIGMNPALDDIAPIDLFHIGESQQVVDAARNLLGD